MPQRTDIHRIFIIGSGPIVIGQACEFDYSGTQACKALREEGYSVVLVNSNPATIMTDPETADRSYIEPLTWSSNGSSNGNGPTRCCRRSAGRPGLNLAVALAEKGILEKYNCELIGAKLDAIKKPKTGAVQRRDGRVRTGCAKSLVVHSLEEAQEFGAELIMPRSSARVHAGRFGRGHVVQQGRIRIRGVVRTRRKPGHGSAGRGVRASAGKSTNSR
jgi:carbamoyl-phosphate synthase large subunit